MTLIIIFVLAGLWLLPGGVGAGPGLPLGSPPAAPSEVAPFPSFAAPAQMFLCGEPVPLNEPEVREALDREFIIEVWSRAQTTMWLKRAHRYFPEIERKLRARRLPLDLKYVALAESDLRTQARSSVGALGPWQFMGPTAQRFRLRCDKAIDERLDFGAATDAALSYLENLHRLFHSWPLALAAYNAGEGRVQKAIAVQGVNNYYHLSLPEETERYIYRILAAKIIMEDPGRYGYAIPEDQLYPPLACDEVQLTLAQEVPVRRLAEASGTYYKVIKRLNPWIKGDSLAPGTFRLKIPSGSAPRFQAVMRQGEPAGPAGAGTKQ
ncbi:MAG: lytic transglycosylase domain-containing protein [Desulfobacterales bacterium]|nr:lytic transglycosylase domain-containing protein [Pseudomonadota bacterium]MCG2770539.1 lytic transglycosylase domain-containing protein [Desulfobacterales bacterium]